MNTSRLIGVCSLVVIFAVFFVFRSRTGQALETVVLNGNTMGTSYQVKYVLPSIRSPRKRQTMRESVEKNVEAALQVVNSLMSTYDQNSQLSKLNQYTGSEPFPIDARMAEVLRLALTIAEKTDGKYDPTVGPLVNLWRFGPDARPERIPTDDEIQAARLRVGYKNIELITRPDGTFAVRKLKPEVYIDLSSIAKGYGVDAVAASLRQLGLERFLVDIGGELYGVGLNGQELPWRIGIRRPQPLSETIPGSQGISQVMPLADQAVATSGDYLNFYEQNGRRYSHLIDPQTGRPIDHRTASVTVIAPTCAVADGWATALIVTGQDKGTELARQENLHVLFITKPAPTPENPDPDFQTLEVKQQ